MHGNLSGSRSIYHTISRVSLLSLKGEEDTAPKYRLLRQLILQLRSKPPCVAIINSKARTLDIRFSAALGLKLSSPLSNRQLDIDLTYARFGDR